MAISLYTSELYHFLIDGQNQMATGGTKPRTEMNIGISVYPQAIIAPNVQKIGIKYLDRLMPKHIARNGIKNMDCAIIRKTDSNNRAPKSKFEKSPNAAANELTTIHISLKIATPAQIKPIHCTTINAGGFGCSCPPFTLALSTALMIRTSPIITPS